MKSPSIPVLIGLVFSLVCDKSLAIPNTFFGGGNFFGPVIPAQPVFGRDLTVAFFEKANWDTASFPGPWQTQSALEGMSVKKMTANPTLFGAVPMSVYAYGNDETPTKELAIHFLDAGQYFGYLYGGEKTSEQKATGNENRANFTRLFSQLSSELRRRLDEGCGKGTLGTVGKSSQLRTCYTQYQWQDFVLRLVTVPDYSVSLFITKQGEVPTYFDPKIQKLGRSEKESFFATHVTTTSVGDSIIERLPMFTQGNTPFCGIHSLAMVGHYLGLRVHPETLAAGADFKNTGSAKGSRIFDLYRSVGQEIDMKVSTSPKFDPKRARQSIEAGIPLIVWRRVSLEREKVLNEYHQAFANDPSLAVLANPLNLYPQRDAKGSPSHASVITGFNAERNEVIFTEPWGDSARNRRMSYEEMEATAYAVFYFKL